MSASIAEVRGELATALASVGASVYGFVPEAVIPPACIIMPSDGAYLESTLISKSTVSVRINFTITAAVAYNSNPGALDNLETLVIQILGAMPDGYVVGDVQRPTITNIGTSSLLIADLAVSTYYNQDQE
jgi:hypothetical protein